MDANPPAPLTHDTAREMVQANPALPFNGEDGYYIAIQSTGNGKKLPRKVHLRNHHVS